MLEIQQNDEKPDRECQAADGSKHKQQAGKH